MFFDKSSVIFSVVGEVVVPVSSSVTPSIASETVLLWLVTAMPFSVNCASLAALVCVYPCVPPAVGL